MQHYQFDSTRSVEEALRYLSEKGERCRVIAGGTDLIPKLRLDDIHPEFILNILEIEELRGIREEENSITIGPTTTFTEVIESKILSRHFPCLIQAAVSVGGTQIRNRGTIGGNIANASPAADVLPAILALGGDIELRSKASGARTLPLAKAIEGPYRPLIRSDEILTRIIIRKLEGKTRTAFEKLGHRNAMARAQMNLSVVLRLDKEDKILEGRIVPGAILPVARRMKDAEKVLLGKPPEASLIEASVEALADEVSQESEVRLPEYKVPVLKNLARRLLKQCLLKRFE